MIEVAHWSALVPLGVLLLARRDAPAVYWIVALAFAVSWFADAYAEATGGSWAAGPWYLAVQWALFVLAITKPGVGPLMPAIAVYAGLGTVFMLGMVQYRDEPTPYETFMSWWYVYQSCRLIAFGLFARAAWRVQARTATS